MVLLAIIRRFLVVKSLDEIWSSDPSLCGADRVNVAMRSLLIISFGESPPPNVHTLYNVEPTITSHSPRVNPNP